MIRVVRRAYPISNSALLVAKSGNLVCLCPFQPTFTWNWEQDWLLTLLGCLQSLQAAIEGYSLNAASTGQAGSVEVWEGEIGAIPSGSLDDPYSYTAWASIFPTAPYRKNDFYRSAPDQPRRRLCGPWT